MSNDPRTITVSEFVAFLFKSQLVDYTSDEAAAAHPELKGMSGMQLRTFRDSSSPVQESYQDGLYDTTSSRRNSFNRSRFSSESTVMQSPKSAYSYSPSENMHEPSGSGQGWRVFGSSHSRQSSTGSAVSTRSGTSSTYSR